MGITLSIPSSGSKSKIKRDNPSFHYFLIILVGMIFFIVGMKIFYDSKIDDSWPKVSGKISSYESERNVDDDIQYSVNISYSVKSVAYEKKHAYVSLVEPTVGKSAQIAYNPNDPSEAKVYIDKNLRYLNLLFPGFGLIIMIVTIIFYKKFKKRNTDITNLIKSGRKIQGIVIGVDYAGKTNSRRLFKIKVSAVNLSGETQEYTSDRVKGADGLYAYDYKNNSINVDVYVDISNPESYYVDTSVIPQINYSVINEIGKAVGELKDLYNSGRNNGQQPENVDDKNLPTGINI